MADFVALPTGNTLLDRIQAAIASAFSDLRGAPWTRAVQIDNVSLTTTAKAVYHGLGRVPRRWQIVRRTGYGVVTEGALHTDNLNHINLSASIAGTFSVLVE